MADFRRVVRKRFARKEDIPLELEGRTGNASNVVAVPGRANMIYVTVGGSTLKVTNDLVDNRPGKPVLIVREKRGWRVKGSKAGVSFTTSPGITPHGNSHGWMGIDTVMCNIRQITWLRVAPVRGTMLIEVGRGVITLGATTYLVDPAAAIDLTANIPATAGKSRFVLITVSNLGVITLTNGADFNHADLALTSIPAAPTGHYRLAAVRLYNTQTQLSENIYYTDVVDLRFAALEPLANSGDVTGPEGATDGNLVVFDGATGKIVKDGGPVPVIVNVRQFIFTVEGTLTAAANPLRIYNCTGATLTISKVFLAANTAPTGAAVIADIHKDGTTIFTNQAHRPEIADGTNSGQSTTIDVAAWADGEYLQMIVDQIGSTVAGSNLSVYVVAS